MRTDRYRQVGTLIHEILRTFAPDGQVEKASYDDFYLDVTAACAGEARNDGGDDDNVQPRCVHVITLDVDGCTKNHNNDSKWGTAMCWQQQQQQSGVVDNTTQPLVNMAASSVADHSQTLHAGSFGAVAHHGQGSKTADAVCSTCAPAWHLVEPHLRRGVAVAVAIRAQLQQALGITVSCGVAAGKLLARLVGPVNKPDAITVLPAGISQAWICKQRVMKIPQLTQKSGAQVRTEHLIYSINQVLMSEWLPPV